MFLRLFPAPSLFFFFSALIYFVFFKLLFDKKKLYVPYKVCFRVRTRTNTHVEETNHCIRSHNWVFRYMIFYFFFLSRFLYFLSLFIIYHICTASTHKPVLNSRHIYADTYTFTPICTIPSLSLILSIWKVLLPSMTRRVKKRNLFLLGIWNRPSSGPLFLWN